MTLTAGLAGFGHRPASRPSAPSPACATALPRLALPAPDRRVSAASTVSASVGSAGVCRVDGPVPVSSMALPSMLPAVLSALSLSPSSPIDRRIVEVDGFGVLLGERSQQLLEHDVGDQLGIRGLGSLLVGSLSHATTPPGERHHSRRTRPTVLRCAVRSRSRGRLCRGPRRSRPSRLRPSRPRRPG